MCVTATVLFLWERHSLSIYNKLGLVTELFFKVFQESFSRLFSDFSLRLTMKVINLNPLLVLWILFNFSFHIKCDAFSHDNEVERYQIRS